MYSRVWSDCDRMIVPYYTHNNKPNQRHWNYITVEIFKTNRWIFVKCCAVIFKPELFPSTKNQPATLIKQTGNRTSVDRTQCRSMVYSFVKSAVFSCAILPKRPSSTYNHCKTATILIGDHCKKSHSLKVCSHVMKFAHHWNLARYYFVSENRISGSTGDGPILSVLHTITIGAMLNLISSWNIRLKFVMYEQCLEHWLKPLKELCSHRNEAVVADRWSQGRDFTVFLCWRIYDVCVLYLFAIVIPENCFLFVTIVHA